METSKTPRSTNITKTDFGDDYNHLLLEYFNEKPENFEKFVTEMADLKIRKKPLPESLKRLCFLLRKSSSLLLKLNDYLPPGCKVYKEGVLTKVTVNDNLIYELEDEQNQQYSSQNLCENRVNNLMIKIQRRFTEEKDTLRSIRNCIELYATSKEYTSEKLFNDMRHHLSKEIDLLLEFIEILPDSRNYLDKLKLDKDITTTGVLGKRKRGQCESLAEYHKKRRKYSFKRNGTRIFNVVQRIKNSLKSDKMSTEFLKCMYLFINGEISREEVIHLIKTMLCNGHKELYEEFLSALDVRTDGTVKLGNNSFPLSKPNGNCLIVSLYF